MSKKNGDAKILRNLLEQGPLNKIPFDVFDEGKRFRVKMPYAPSREDDLIENFAKYAGRDVIYDYPEEHRFM